MGCYNTSIAHESSMIPNPTRMMSFGTLGPASPEASCMVRMCSSWVLHKGGMQSTLCFEGSRLLQPGLHSLSGQTAKLTSRWPWGTPQGTVRTDQPCSFLHNSTKCQKSATDVKYTPTEIKFTHWIPWGYAQFRYSENPKLFYRIFPRFSTHC